MEPLVFDIETGPETDETLALMEPEFSAPANYRDAAKIAEKIAEQREAWREKAALDATTGRVLAIGLQDAAGTHLLTVDGAETAEEFRRDEADVIAEFWNHACPDGRWRTLIGFNSNRFDIPFLVRRSFKLRVPVPNGVTHGRYLGRQFVDLMEIWKVGDYQATVSLDRLAKHLGCGAKNGDGARFAELLENDREAALDYLRNDIEMTCAVAERLGVIEPEPAY